MNIMYRLRIPESKEGIIQYPREVQLPLTSCPASWIDEIDDMVYETISHFYLIPIEWKFEEEPDYCWRKIRLPPMSYIRELERKAVELERLKERNRRIRND